MRPAHAARRLLTTLGLLIAAAGTEAAEEVKGRARVIDASTIEIAGTRVRLIGVDAPDLDQTCPTRKGGSYECGKVAADTLAKIVARETLTCAGERRDANHRLLARCAIRGFDVGEQFVLTGRAFADPEHGADYRRAENAARTLNEGMWRGRFVWPWEWRAGKRLPD